MVGKGGGIGRYVRIKYKQRGTAFKLMAREVWKERENAQLSDREGGCATRHMPVTRRRRRRRKKESRVCSKFKGMHTRHIGQLCSSSSRTSIKTESCRILSNTITFPFTCCSARVHALACSQHKRSQKMMPCVKGSFDIKCGCAGESLTRRLCET